MAKQKVVRVIVDGNKLDFSVTGKTKRGKLKIHQNEGLFTSEFVEAVRKLGRHPNDCRNGRLVGRTGLWVCGERESFEETGMVVQCISIDHYREAVFTTSDILTEDGAKVYMTSYLLADYLHGGTQMSKSGKETVKPLEPEKCKMWHWVTIDELVAMIRTDKQRQWIPLNRVIKYLKEAGLK